MCTAGAVSFTVLMSGFLSLKKFAPGSMALLAFAALLLIARSVLPLLQ